jgi:DNA-directed RNA polymerase subunit L
MQALPSMAYSYSSSDDVPQVNPRIELISKINDDELQFTISGLNVSFVNAIRRVILSEIPMVVFRVSPNDKNKCNIIANTCGLNNEIVKHRLSCIPIHIKDVEDFPLKNYIMELNVENNTDTTIIVTSEDFVIKDLVSSKILPKDKIREIFPANDLTGGFIDFVRLKAKAAEELQPKKIHLTCEFDIGTAKEDGAYNAVSTCSYGNTIDDAAQEAKLAQLKQKWKDEGKKENEIEFEATNWKLLEGKRIFKKDSFNFIVQSIGVHTNTELLTMSCLIMIEKLNKLDTLIEEDNLEIKVADNTMKNCYDIVLENEDYTIGKVIEYSLLTLFYELTGSLKFCGFKMLHPHDSYSLIRVAYKEPMEISGIKGNLKKAIIYSLEIFGKIRKEFLKLVPR